MLWLTSRYFSLLTLILLGWVLCDELCIKVHCTLMILACLHNFFNFDWNTRFVTILEIITLNETMHNFIICDHVVASSARKEAHSFSCDVVMAHTLSYTPMKVFLHPSLFNWNCPKMILSTPPRVLNAFACHFWVALWCSVNYQTQLFSIILQHAVLICKIILLWDKLAQTELINNLTILVHWSRHHVLLPLRSINKSMLP